MSSLSDYFDAYSLRARTYPGFLTALPIVSIVGVLWPHSPIAALWPLALSVGVLFLLANWVRDRGKDLEDRLTAVWDGLPTTHLLRYRENSGLSFERRRSLLSTVTGIALPTGEQETADNGAADDVYVTATKALISQVRARQEHFARVQDENTYYGFRRNLLAMKPFGLLTTGGALVFDVIWLTITADALGWVLLGVHVLAAVAWVRIVTADWVLRQGRTYAERLFEALEDPILTT